MNSHTEGMVKKGEPLTQKGVQRASALERVCALFDSAALVFAEHPAQAHRLVKEARSLALQNRLRLPATLKRRVCKKCHSFWVPGKTVRVRVREKRVAYTCLVCKDMRRIRIG